MKKVIVLGGTGFVGTQVCTLLALQGWKVSLALRHVDRAAHMRSLPGLSPLVLDVHDEVALARALAGHDAAVNLVAILHGTQAAFEQVHVALVHKLARALRAAGVPRLVHVSAIGADAQDPGSAPSMYLRSKGAGEAALLQAAALQPSALQLTILRPSVIFGAADKFLNVFARLQDVLPVVPLAGAQARFQPVWVHDVATAVARSLQPVHEAASRGNPARIIEACGPEVFTLRELVQLAGQLHGIRAGRGRPVFGLPDWLARLQATLMQLSPGEPVMSRDNLDSMKVDNVASGTLPGLTALGIEPSALQPIAAQYLRRGSSASPG